MDKKRLAVIRIRGRVHVRSGIEDTLKLLNLNKVNHCILVGNSGQYIGMIKKVKDYVTWGEANTKTVETLIKERGRVGGNLPLTDDYLKKHSKYEKLNSFVDDYVKFKAELKDVKGLKPVFRLKPPTKGHERRGIKKHYSVGGVLGNRGEKIKPDREDVVNGPKGQEITQDEGFSDTRIRQCPKAQGCRKQGWPGNGW